MDLLSSFLGRQGFLPHGYCFTWSPGVLWTMVGSDLAIAGAYFSIPLAIGSFVRQRKDPSLHLVALLFCAFILACGTTHLMDVWTIWEPDYRLQALDKGLTAVVSILTAVLLWPLIPQALRVPSVAELQQAVASLESEVRQRRTVEETLIDTQQSLAVTLASIGAGFMAADRQGRITAMNEVAERIFGWTEPEARGHPFWSVASREGLAPEEATDNPVETLMADHITVAVRREWVAVSRDGTPTPLEARAALTRSPSGEVRGMVMVFQDLTTLRRIEAERQQAEEKFRLVVESAPSAILMVDSRRRITLANQRTDELFGYARESLIGQPIDMLVPELSRDALLGQALRLPGEPPAALPTPEPGRETVARRRDGREIPVEIGLRPIETAEGRFTLASIIDLSERRRREDELRRSNAELEQFAYIASHDLQEPLRMVVSYSELLAQRYQGQLDERADKYIRYAVDGARRMQRLVADLLAYSRVGSQGRPLEPVDAAQTVQRVQAALRAQILETRAKITATALPTVLADPTQLEQLFQNLIGNAIKFRSDEPPEVSISARRERQFWRFFVRDNGIGIDMQYAERIFQMFQRLHERGRYEGSGIGLAIVKRIIERHGGQITLESRLGQGTTFSFTLPADLDAGPGLIGLPS
jgi:PAS domain S-box-containing protein